MKKLLGFILIALAISLFVFYEVSSPPRESRLNPPQFSIKTIRLVENGISTKSFDSSSRNYSDISHEAEMVIRTASAFYNKPAALALSIPVPIDKFLEEDTKAYIVVDFISPVVVNGKAFESSVYVLDSNYGHDFVFFQNGLSDRAGYFGVEKKFNREVLRL